MKKDYPMSPREIKNAETAYRAAESRMVLLENHNRVLPIKKCGALFINQSGRYHIHIYDAYQFYPPS